MTLSRPKKCNKSGKTAWCDKLCRHGSGDLTCLNRDVASVYPGLNVAIIGVASG